MKPDTARNQLCKMAGEIATALGLTSSCTCGGGPSYGTDVPDEIIDEMWKAICAHVSVIHQQRKTMNLNAYQLEILAALNRHEGWVSRRDLYFELCPDARRDALEHHPHTLRLKLIEAVYNPVKKMVEHKLVEERTEGTKSYIQLTDEGRKFVKEVINEDHA